MKQDFDANEHAELIFGRNAVLEAIKADTPINHILVTSMTGSLGVICREAKKRGIGLMFDAKQMTAMLQQVGNVSDKTAIEAIGKLARSNDGARVGFELTH